MSKKDGGFRFRINEESEDYDSYFDEFTRSIPYSERAIIMISLEVFEGLTNKSHIKKIKGEKYDYLINGWKVVISK